VITGSPGLVLLHDVLAFALLHTTHPVQIYLHSEHEHRVPLVGDNQHGFSLSRNPPPPILWVLEALLGHYSRYHTSKQDPGKRHASLGLGDVLKQQQIYCAFDKDPLAELMVERGLRASIF
jgi:hypothetical protein